MNMIDTIVKGFVWLDRAEGGPFTYFDTVESEQN